MRPFLRGGEVSSEYEQRLDWTGHVRQGRQGQSHSPSMAKRSVNTTKPRIMREMQAQASLPWQQQAHLYRPTSSSSSATPLPPLGPATASNALRICGSRMQLCGLMRLRGVRAARRGRWQCSGRWSGSSSEQRGGAPSPPAGAAHLALLCLAECVVEALVHHLARGARGHRQRVHAPAAHVCRLRGR